MSSNKMKENSENRRSIDTVKYCTEKSDEEIMKGVVNDPELFGVLIERYEDKLRRYMLRIMPGLREDVDDLLQDVFVKTYVNVNGFDPKQKFSSWVYRIAHNESVSWLRKKKARPDLVELGDEDFQTFTRSMEDAFEDSETVLAKDEVARIMGDMEERYRSVLVLKFLEGRNYEEISDILAMPTGTVATQIHRAKKQFSSLYQKQHG